MAEAAERLCPPIPPWRIHLIGAENDLRDLANEHSLGHTRVIHFHGEYFLEADVLNELSDSSRVVEKAQEILQLIGGLARVRRFSPFHVKAASVLWTDGNGNWVGRTPLGTEKFWVVPGTKYLEGANISEHILALAETNGVVRMTLMDFLGEWDFSRLRRIVDSVLIDLGGDKKKGAAEVLRREWATELECTRFDKSANFGSEYYRGAHSPLEPAKDQNENPMPLAAAVEFVRQLLARWIESKIATAK